MAQPLTTRPSLTGPRRGYVVEIKPNAGYVALGQVLCYRWAWNRLFHAAWPAQALILTDFPKPYMPELCGLHGITLVSLNRMLVEPPSYPT